MITPHSLPVELTRELLSILDDSLSQAQELQDALAAERDALRLEDTDALQAALSAKSARVNRLQCLDAARVALCEAAGASAGPDQMERVLERCDNGSHMAERWMQLLETAALCSTLNMTNGAIIQMRQQMIESNLAVLRGSDAGSVTYKREGRDSAATSQRSLAQA